LSVLIQTAKGWHATKTLPFWAETLLSVEASDYEAAGSKRQQESAAAKT